MVAPSIKERPQRFVRSQINFNALDHVGHGTRVAEKNQVLDDRYSKKEVRRLKQSHVSTAEVERQRHNKQVSYTSFSPSCSAYTLW